MVDVKYISGFIIINENNTASILYIREHDVTYVDALLYLYIE